MTGQKTGHEHGQKPGQKQRKPRIRRTLSIAKRTALDVLDNIGQGKKASVTALAQKNGATFQYAQSGAVQKTKEFRDTINNALDKMQRIRENALIALEGKDFSVERVDTLVRSTSSLTHDIQLLSGGKTDNLGIEEDKRILLAIVAQLRGNT